MLLTAGLLPSLIREGSYSAIRMGGYEPVKRAITGPGDTTLPLYKVLLQPARLTRQPPFLVIINNSSASFQKIFAGACSGSAGSFFTTPLDLAKIRLQTDVQNR